MDEKIFLLSLKNGLIKGRYDTKEEAENALAYQSDPDDYEVLECIVVPEPDYSGYTEEQKEMIRFLKRVPYTDEELEYLDPFIRLDYTFDQLYDEYRDHFGYHCG